MYIFKIKDIQAPKPEPVESVQEQLDAAYEALDAIQSGEATAWNGIGWNGDSRNQYGRDCVLSAIWDSIDELEAFRRYARNCKPV